MERKSLFNFSKLDKYSKEYGVECLINSMGEQRVTRMGSIVFNNGRVASIVETDAYGDIKFSVATCDYDGYFNWTILNEYGAENGKFVCDTEEDIIKACEIIRNL